MTKHHGGVGFFVGWRWWFIPLVGAATPVQAQISTDGSLGPAGPLTGPDYQIPAALGRQVGPNLFHSFSTFDLANGESATFSGPSAIQTIVGRVTGGAASTIDGTVRSTIQGADLFLANPAGLVFGPNAQLSVDGSFHATTADVLVMADGTTLATGSATAPSLSVAPPAAFGFMGPNGGLTAAAGEWAVTPERSISLSGGTVTVTGLVAAPGGTLDVAAVGDGEVQLARGTWTTNPGVGVALGDVVVGDGGELSIAHGAAGVLRVRGANLTLDGGVIDASAGAEAEGSVQLILDNAMRIVNDGQLLLPVTGLGDGADLTVQAQVLFLGPTSGLPIERPGIDASVAPGATGSAGRLAIDVAEFAIVDNRINATTAGPGDAAELDIAAERFEIRGNTYFAPFDFFAGIGGTSDGAGQGAEVAIRAVDIVFFGDAGVVTDVRSTGDARGVTIEAVNIDIDGGPGGQPLTLNSGFASSTFGAGAGGVVRIRTDSLSLQRGAGVVAASVGSGIGGNIEIDAQSIFMDSQSSPATTVITTTSLGAGRGGDIVVRTDDLTILNGNTAITADAAAGSGDAGSVLVEAQTIEIGGSGEDLAMGISSGTFPGSSGDGGSLTVRTGELRVASSGAVSSSTFGSGAAGQLRLEADTVVIGDGGFVGSLTTGPGEGGDVVVVAESLTIAGGGSVRADAVPADFDLDLDGGAFDAVEDGAGDNSGGFAEFGDAGNITIAASTVAIQEEGGVLALAVNSGGGNIAIAADRLTLAEGATINASVASGTSGGGNIAVDALTVVALDGSAIVARADQGFGGNILLEADVFLRNGDVTLDASSNVAGNSGAVAVNAPELDLSGQLLALALRFFDSSAALGSCRASASGESGFAVARLNSSAIDPAGLRLSRIELAAPGALVQADPPQALVAGPPVTEVVGCLRLAG